ncbi:MAG: DUF763 domain-containing protein [Armatimonadota bacterium]|nr:DUF763 domain-containing protein [Armatimonadota bacterium]MDR7452534.1 DUF763 domain-containing protein [Armatimonadota bacterium]MDR7467761.1 DUF763 domain-containing protein [Armatimonadota bacterium]MDR7494961.1 DUF763 domain-containing protein [Armatimonadota bacterium]MDR7499774.1 DUF763 domain-containing protein [Armatimonadota bacterium]
MRRTGTAVLPLHGGRAPRWLFERMTRLARAVVAALVEDGGPEVVLRRLSDPFWFQALGCLLGFDWHSSGVTTTVCGALKEGLRGTERDLGLLVAGGKGRASRRTPEELRAYGDRFGLDAPALVYASRLSAKVDNNAVQDGYQLYHHTFFLTTSGQWAVIQQGMRPEDRTARRYHWLGERVESFVREPHAAVCCDLRAETLNLVAAEGEEARGAMAALARRPAGELANHLERLSHLALPSRHAILARDLNPARLSGVFLHTYEAQPQTFEALLGLPKVGAKTLRALALLSELLAGAPLSWRDPARYAFAHGGKDGIPFPVDRLTYDRTTGILEEAVRRARIGEPERLRALRRLQAFVATPGAPRS